MFRGQWNNHGLSSERGRSPQQLFALGMLEKRDTELTAVRDVFSTNGVPGQPEDSMFPENIEHLLGRTRVDVPNIQCPLSPEQQRSVGDMIDSSQHVTDHGLSLYVNARQNLPTL